MPRKTSPGDDDWHNVEDSKKRKQIQDRLAQRARRKRLREARVHAKHEREEPETPCEEVVTSSHEPHGPSVSACTELQLVSNPRTYQISSLMSSTECKDLTLWNSAGSPGKLESVYQCALVEFDDSFVPPLVSPSSQPQFPLTVFGALYINGQILGLLCSEDLRDKSPPVDDSVPVPLRPTGLQLVKSHPRWIDRMPFPRFRDNFINLDGIIDEEEFLHDLFTAPSFQLKAGNTPWDPRGWQIEKPYAEKWGYLFY